MAVISGISIAMEGYRFYIFENAYNGTISYEQAVQFDQIYAGLGLIDLLLYILSAIFFIMWFRRAYYNLHQLMGGLRYSEGWAAGAWFIPIFSLFGPYQIATDLYTKTEGLLVNKGLIDSKPSRHSVKGWWWGLWIAGSVFGNISTRGSLEMINFSIFTAIISAILLLISALLAVKVIDNYHEMEVKLSHLDDVSQTNLDNNDLLDAL
ncbi:MAG: hypothetical protein Crog4KO_02080 [Crocinitomicaceae bacterium]